MMKWTSRSKLSLAANDIIGGHGQHSNYQADSLREIGIVISESLYLLEDQFRGPFYDEKNISAQNQAPVADTYTNQWRFVSYRNSSVENFGISMDKTELLDFNIQMMPCLLIQDAIIPLTASDLMFLLGDQHDLNELANDLKTEAFKSSTSNTIQQQYQLPNVKADEVLPFGRLQYIPEIIADAPAEGLDLRNISMIPCVITGTAIVPLSPSDLLDLVGHKVDRISGVVSLLDDQRIDSSLEYTNLVNVPRPSSSQQLCSNHDVPMSPTSADYNNICNAIIPAASSYNNATNTSFDDNEETRSTSVSTELSNYKNTYNNNTYSPSLEFSMMGNVTNTTITATSAVSNNEKSLLISIKENAECGQDSIEMENVAINSVEGNIPDNTEAASISANFPIGEYDFGSRNMELNIPICCPTSILNAADDGQMKNVAQRNIVPAHKRTCSTYSNKLTQGASAANSSIVASKNECNGTKSTEHEGYIGTNTEETPPLATDMIYLIKEYHLLNTNHSDDISMHLLTKYLIQFPIENAYLTQNASTLPITQVLNSNEYIKEMNTYYLFGDKPLSVKHKIQNTDSENTNPCTCKCAKLSQMKTKRVCTRTEYKKVYPSNKKLLNICGKVKNSKPYFL